MKERIRIEIETFVEHYQHQCFSSALWKKPLVGFGDANHPLFGVLEAAGIEQALQPEDMMAGVNTVIAYFIPFVEEIVLRNSLQVCVEATAEWGMIYNETNAMMAKLNDHMVEKIHQWGYQADICNNAGYNGATIKSRWSHRHIARISGLGTFGLNNMLITKVGCAGRYQSFVANIPVVFDAPVVGEYCLAKQGIACDKCLRACPVGALHTPESGQAFDRVKCRDVCFENEKQVHAACCAKCVCDMPCSFQGRLN